MQASPILPGLAIPFFCSALTWALWRARHWRGASPNDIPCAVQGARAWSSPAEGDPTAALALQLEALGPLPPRGGGGNSSRRGKTGLARRFAAFVSGSLLAQGWQGGAAWASSFALWQGLLQVSQGGEWGCCRRRGRGGSVGQILLTQ